MNQNHPQSLNNHHPPESPSPRIMQTRRHTNGNKPSKLKLIPTRAVKQLLQEPIPISQPPPKQQPAYTILENEGLVIAERFTKPIFP